MTFFLVNADIITDMPKLIAVHRLHLRPAINGLFPGLKKCPPDTFLRRKAVAALFESYITKKEHHPIGWCSFLVDDIGLEPMTFRTSSGCSSQLS